MASIAPKTGVGDRPHRVTLQNPGPAAADGDGGFTQVYTDCDPPQMNVRIQPLGPGDIERPIVGTVMANATHLITMPFHPQLTTQTRIVYTDRLGTHVYSVLGPADLDLRHVELRLYASELVV